MHHDPFQNLIQTNPMLGSYYGAPTALNPLAAAAQGGILPQQIAALLASQAGAIPQFPGLSPLTPGIQNLAAVSNPMLQQPGLNPLLALASAAAQQLALQQQQSPYAQFGQIGSPFGQFGYPQQQQMGYPQQQMGYPQQQQPWQFGQQAISPFAQTGYPQQHSPAGYPQSQPFGQGALPLAQFGYPHQHQPQIGNLLAPQSWVGQAGTPYGQQIQPLLAQLAGRPLQGPVGSPWGW